MLSGPLDRVRVLGKLEAVSFIALLGVAMPLKYAAGLPIAVRIVGIAHGLLFLALCYATVLAKAELKWSMRQAALIIIAALLPFGPFVIDSRLQQQQTATD